MGGCLWTFCHFLRFAYYNWKSSKFLDDFCSNLIEYLKENSILAFFKEFFKTGILAPEKWRGFLLWGGFLLWNRGGEGLEWYRWDGKFEGPQSFLVSLPYKFFRIVAKFGVSPINKGGSQNLLDPDGSMFSKIFFKSSFLLDYLMILCKQNLQLKLRSAI